MVDAAEVGRVGEVIAVVEGESSSSPQPSETSIAGALTGGAADGFGAGGTEAGFPKVE